MDSVKIVVFDLGGVLVRVARTWREAAAHAGVALADPGLGDVALVDLDGFEAYQGKQIGLQEFLQSLRVALGLESVEDALKVHHGILMEAYPGTEDWVAELAGAGYRTACLSNTNAAHWNYLRDAGHYPAIASLQLTFASHILGLSKPDGLIYQALEEATGFSGSEILFFDDTAPNVSAALERGWQAFVIDPSGDTVGEMRGHFADVCGLPRAYRTAN